MVTQTQDRISTEPDARSHDGRSLGDLIKALRDETTLLLREEVALARTEMSEKAARLSRNSAWLGIGGMVAYAGLLMLLAAGAIGLALGLVEAGLSAQMAAWLSPLIIGLVVAIIGYALVQKAISTLRREKLVPERTVETLKQDRDWMKEKVQ
jgi:hypothetical protein